ncbi:MAG TPA: DNA repair protein RecN [Solirubrobacteraceae bacterium]|nr:DNA repair protein RecN [Solirubrobacteraceae bacterium]
MLHELRVENLLLIERAELSLVPGLNVLTGETGAGKTVLAHALDLLLGGKPRAGIVRPGASEAYVEGVFALPAALRAALADRLPEDADELVLARRVSAEGRTRAYLGGRSATAAELADIGGALLSFYGQHEHRRLTLASAQLEILDGFCGPDQASRREEFAAAYAHERGLREELEALRARAGARDRELDLVNWELEEIDRAEPSVEDEHSLLAERERLRHVTTLLGAAAGAAAALSGDGGGDGYDDASSGHATDGLAATVAALESATGVDAALDALAERARALAVEAEDLAGELRRYGEAVDAPPGRLDEVEERLALFDRLKRKHGGTIEAVMAHAEECRRRRDELAGAEEALEAGEGRLEAARAQLAAQAEGLREARLAAAGGLADAVRERLAGLAMEGATFEARLAERDGYGPTGGDEVEFLIAPNPGVPAGPLRETASGGELSRVMLALMGVAAQAGPATLVFDEVDAGIGGQTARAVGEQLRGLAAGRQIICITHLPQIASLADRHFTIVKDTSGATASTTVTRLEKTAVVGELVRMLGAEDGDAAARRHARELLKAA